MLPSEKRNRLFDGWTPEARHKHRMVKAGRGGRHDGQPVVLARLPIIPLVGSAAPTVPSPPWPTLTRAEFDELTPRIRRRLGRVWTPWWPRT